MRIAYLIICHIDPKHIRRLAIKITQGTENEAFIHVDKKSDFGAFARELADIPQVHLLNDRVDVYWGGYASIEATILLFRAGLAAEPGFDRFVILQGLDYPIKSNQEIQKFFESNPEKEFMLGQNISQSKNPKDIHKYRLYWNLDRQGFLAFLIKGINSVLFLSTGLIPPFKRNYAVDHLGNKMEIHQGCAEFSVTRALAEYIVRFHDENPEYNRYFHSVYAADESYFHTIVYCSPFVRNTPNGKPISSLYLGSFKNLTYYEYPTVAKLFTEKQDWPTLRDSGFLYFRKASSESAELLDYIDSIHAMEQNGAPTV